MAKKSQKKTANKKIRGKQPRQNPNLTNRVALIRGERFTKKGASFVVVVSPGSGKARGTAAAAAAAAANEKPFNIRTMNAYQEGPDGKKMQICFATPSQPYNPKSSGKDSDSQFLSSNSQTNYDFLCEHMSQEDLDLLSKLTFPPEMLDPEENVEYTIPKNCGSTREDTKRIMGETAKDTLTRAGQWISEQQHPKLNRTSKLAITRFFKLFDVKMPGTRKIPSAEWCHLLAVSLTPPDQDPNIPSNLFAAMCLINTKMTLLESTARRFAKEGRNVKYKITYRCLKGHSVVVELKISLVVDDLEPYVQYIPPFGLPEIGTIYDADYFYNHIQALLNDEKLHTIKKEKLVFSQQNPEPSSPNSQSSAMLYSSLVPPSPNERINKFLRKLEDPSPLKPPSDQASKRMRESEDPDQNNKGSTPKLTN